MLVCKSPCAIRDLFPENMDMGRHSNQMCLTSYKEIMLRLNFLVFGNAAENITLCSHNSINRMSYHLNTAQTINGA